MNTHDIFVAFFVTAANTPPGPPLSLAPFLPLRVEPSPPAGGTFLVSLLGCVLLLEILLLS